MPGFPSFLDRFRRILAPPGRPAEALGVPASTQDLESELAPLVGELDSASEQAEGIRQRALEESERRRQAAAREAAAIREQARARAVAARSRAATARREQGRQDGAESQAEARREADRISAAREERIAALVAEVVECVRRSGR